MRCLFLSVLLSFSFSIWAQAVPNKHVILIGLDGVRRDAFHAMLTQVRETGEVPAFIEDWIGDGVMNDLVYAGRDKQGAVQQYTFSAPGWVTILTGVWANKHHVEFNPDINQGKYNRDYPTIFNDIKAAYPTALTASFTDWQDLQTIGYYEYTGSDAADINAFIAPAMENETIAERDDRLTQAVITQIQQDQPPIFIFTHYELIDEAGHNDGFGSNVASYRQALRQSAAYMNAIARAIRESEKKGQQWLVIITTDHGGHKWFHGTQQQQDQDIFAVFHGKDSPYRGGVTVSVPQDQAMFVPTILDYLGIPVDIEKLDGEKMTVSYQGTVKR